MESLIRSVTVVALLLLLALASPAVAGPITYYYTGNPFSGFMIPPFEVVGSAGPYTGADQVTAAVTLLDPLPANHPILIDVSSDLVSVTISDGVRTWDYTPVDDFYDASVLLATTDGEITGWALYFQPDVWPYTSPNLGPFPGPSRITSCFYLLGDGCQPAYGSGPTDIAVQQGVAWASGSVGTWSASLASVPEPSSTVPVGIGVLVLAGWGRRRSARQSANLSAVPRNLIGIFARRAVGR